MPRRPEPDSSRVPRRSALRLSGRDSAGADELARAQVLVKEGTVRAKNMAHALAMIAYLLTRALVEGVGRRLGSSALRVALAAVGALERRIGPAIARLRARVAPARNQWVRALLLGLIRVLEPLENAAAAGLKAGFEASARLAARSTLSLAEGLRLAVGLLAGLIKRGYGHPLVRVALVRFVLALEKLKAGV